MAGALGCRPGTVKSRLSRALGRLRAAMAEQANGGAPPLTKLQGGGE
jgi:DNA-directed RNA polymerase specialized sigma24 family protein